MTTATDTVLQPLLGTDPAAPLVTHYDVAAGSRVELSVVTTANWAAKIAGLLRDELDVQPGGRVAMDTDAHWLTAGIVLGIWWCGAEVVTADEAFGDAAVLIVSPERIDRHDTDAETLVTTPDPMGRPVTALGVLLPVGVADLTESCRIHPDAFTPRSGGGPAVFDGASLADLSDPALAGRVLLPDPGRGTARALARVLASAGSAVLVTGVADDEAGRAELDRITEVEHTTATS